MSRCFNALCKAKGQVPHLPDKEFRYLRTVIVTAAVYRGFGSELRSRRSLTPPLNLPALGRRQSLYFPFRVGRDLCF